MSMEYAIIIAPLSAEDGGGFLGFAPDLLGCMSDGETREEALLNTQAAIDEWLLTANRRGMQVPQPGAAVSRERREKEHLLKSIAMRPDLEFRRGSLVSLGRVRVGQKGSVVGEYAPEPARPMVH